MCAAASDRSPLGSPAPEGVPTSLALEQALRSLLRVRTTEEMERVVLEAVCQLTSAGAAALYVRRGADFEFRAASSAIGTDWSALAGELGAVAERVTGVRRLSEAVRRKLGSGPRVAAELPIDDETRALLLLGPRVGDGPYHNHELSRLESILEPCGTALQNAALYDRLTSLVLIDPLTGCYNRRGFDEHLRVEMVRANRYRRPLSLVVLDIDHFKQINDTLGHPAGDAVLGWVGEVLRSEFRTMDVVCRLGGDEFGVIFPETSKDEVGRLAERLRGRIASLSSSEQVPAAITASLGTAGFPEDANEPKNLLQAADRALYQAKESGRNRVATA